MLHRENRLRRRWAQFVLKCLRLFPNPKKVIHPARTSLYMDPKCRQRQQQKLERVLFRIFWNALTREPSSQGKASGKIFRRFRNLIYRVLRYQCSNKLGFPKLFFNTFYKYLVCIWVF